MKIMVDGGSSGSGGYLRHLRGVLTARPPEDLEVTLLCSPSQAERVRPVGEHVRLVCPPELDAPRLDVRQRWWWSRFPELVRDVRPDAVLHAHGIVRGDVARVPRAVVHHNLAPFGADTYRMYGASATSLSMAAQWVRLAQGMRRCDGVVFLHEYVRDLVVRQVRGIRGSVLIGNGTPDEYLNLPRAARATLPAKPRVLCVSTLHLTKYQWNLVHAVCDARAATGLDLRLDIVGGGDAETTHRVAAAVRERGAAAFVTMHGSLPADRMRDVYANADLFVFPSAQESWPVTLMEAMASGLPIACSNRMAMPSILRDAGVYLNPAAPASIAAALRTLLADGDLRIRLGGLAQAYAREHTWQDTADRLFEFLRTLALPAVSTAPTMPAPSQPASVRALLGRRP